MSIKLQLACFGISFLYGIFVNWFYHFNKKFLDKSNYFSKVIIYMLMSFLLVIGYIDIFYFVNKGIFHIYFIIVLVLGVLVGIKIWNRKKKVKRDI